MKYTIDRKEKYSLMTLHEENFNSVIAPDVKAQFIMLNSDGTRNLIFDLSDVTFLDSSGLSALLTANRIFKNSNGSFVVTGVKSPSIAKLFEISRLDSILSVVPTMEESVDYIFMEELERDLRGTAAAAGEEE